MFELLTKVFGSKYERELKKIQPLVAHVRSFEKKVSSLTKDQLKGKTADFKSLIEKGQSLDSILPEAFAICIEASKRVLGMTHYDVQIIGGLVLHKGEIAEMKTGEGKTLVATLPVYLNALSGKGVHVVTVNDYLAKRDREWMGQLYHFLGLTTGAIVHDLDDIKRKQAYLADVTYGTNNEFGFDYLRDNMKYSLSSCVQRELNYAIVDECDSILVDEARTPLIISGAKDLSIDKYYAVRKVIPHLQKEKHFTIEEKSKTVSITEEGNTKIEELLGIDNLYDIKHIEYLHNIYQSLKAHYLYKKDVDYMVQGDEVVIVDEFTGRLMPGRRWSEGLHQAIEVKENVKVKTENQTLSTITFQNYFRMYNKLAGMTGTAETEAEEFRKIYKLKVQVIPTNKPIYRKDHDDIIYKTETVKYKHIGEMVKKLHQKNQPILVGTVSIEKSERLSQILASQNIPHKVLNAKYHEKEAEIVAQAGRKSSITIATNMAGRGTDIILGGNPDFLCGPKRKEESDESYQTRLKKIQELCKKEREEVVKAGGLFIIGTERHEARRIDNQLRGRSGRQGDPGASKFYLSLEDDLMRVFGGERMQKMMTTLRMDEEAPITDRLLTRAIANAQKKVEGHNFEIRKHLLEYDDVMNQQRTAIYKKRKTFMLGKNLEREFLNQLEELVSDRLDQIANENMRKEQWNLKALENFLKRSFDLEPALPSLEKITLEQINLTVQEGVQKRFEEKKQNLKNHFESLIQFLFLQTIDARWREHLENVDHLREGINLRAFAQKDPLVEYKKETFHLFESLNLTIAAEVIEKFFKIQISEEDQFENTKSEQLIYNDSSENNLSFDRPQIPNQAHTNKNLNRKQRRQQSKLFKKTRIKI
ncbi:MAG: preprotein translocase subunit SecA [Bdellovibrionaceae bacterium]|nr:preprotein translocase subunit SecA [Pseudobdellovibrionaceae bacterium]